MSYISRYGTLWGQVPQAGGKIWFVAPSSPYTIDGRSYSSSDNNAGDSPEKALATIGQAITNATANVGDVIMLLPGAHTNAANVAINKAGLTFVGYHPYTTLAQDSRLSPMNWKTSVTSTFAGIGYTVSAADTVFFGLNFIPKSAQTLISLNGAGRAAFVDCLVTMSASASTSTKGIVSAATDDSVSFLNCTFNNTVGAQGPAIDVTGLTNFLIDHCTFICSAGSWAVAVQCGAGTTGILRDNDVQCSGTAITIFMDGTGVAANKSLLCTRNYVGVSPGAGFAKNFTNAYCELDNNYLATVGGGTGGTLITSVT